jgi:hypothetical protein
LPPGPGVQAAIAAGANPNLNGPYTLDGVTLQNGGRIDVGVTLQAILSLDDGTTITGGTLSIDSLGMLDNVTGSNTVSAAVVNDGTILVISGTLILSGGFSGPGSVIVDAGATLELSGGTSGNPANVTLNPSGSIVGANNGIEVVQDGYGDLTINSSGSLVGQAGDGLIAELSPTGVGNIMVDALGSLTGTGAGSNGLLAENLNASNSGNVTVTALGGASGGTYGIEAITQGNGNVSVETAGPIAATVQYGIRAVSFGTGNVSVTMDSGTIGTNATPIGSSGIAAANRATASANSAINVTLQNSSSIYSGTTNNLSGSIPAGIVAGFNGTAVNNGSVANSNVNGSVVVNIDDSAKITALDGYGVDAYNYGNGNVTVNDAVNDTSSIGTTISGAEFGIGAYAESGGTGNVAITVGSNATIKVTSPTLGYGYGILGFSANSGVVNGVAAAGTANILIVNSAAITSTGVGINAVNEASIAPALVGSSIIVTNNGSITSGSELTGGTGNIPAGILAGYLGGASIPTNTGAPLPGLYGDVTVNNSGNITATAGDGIRAYNWGTGTVTVNDYAGTISALSNGASPTDGFGNGIEVQDFGPGNIEINANFTASEIAHAAGVVIDSLSTGIHAFNEATTVAAGSEIRIVAYGTINSGSLPDSTDGTSIAAGIHAGYSFNNAPEPGVDGNVVIDDHASIFAASGADGIRGYNYGIGSVDITAEAGTFIAATSGTLRIGIFAFGDDGGNVGVTNDATVTATTAIEATTTLAGISTIHNHGQITGAVVAYDAAFTNESNGVWNLNGNSAFSGNSEITNAGTINTSGISSIATTGILTVNDTGAGTINVLSGSFGFKIGGGATLELGISVPASESVTFQNSSMTTTGTLTLDQASSFAGSISGFSGTTFSNSDHIDLKGFNPNSFHLLSYTNHVLTVTDGINSASLHFNGTYSLGSFIPTTDGSGGTILYDPPVSSSPDTGAAVAQTSGTTSSNAIVAIVTNETLTGNGSGSAFVFDFSGVGHDTVRDFHPETDTLQFNSALFATVQSLLDATHDDGHGNTVIALDAHDTITLTGVTKAQLVPNDFHLA